MKKIIFIANTDKEHICKFHLPTIKCFKDNGWLVDVACSGNEKVDFCDNRFYGAWKRSPFTFKTFKGIRQLKKIFSQNKYDVIYCHTPVGGLVARMAAKKARKDGAKVVYYSHGFHFYKGSSKLAWFVIYPIEKYLSKRTDLLFTLNKEDFELAKKKLSKKAEIKLFPGMGVNFDRLKIDNKAEIRTKYRKDFNVQDKIILTYVAELIPNKNQGILLKVLKKILEKRNDVCLMLVGPDHANGKYQKMANKLGVNDNVIFTGWRSDVGELLAMSDICVASSIREGFGINLVEAMYAGLPVVAVKNRGHEMIVNDGENGFLVPLNDVDAMAQRVLQLIEDENLRNKFSNVDVDKYNAEVIAEKLYKEINAII